MKIHKKQIKTLKKFLSDAKKVGPDITRNYGLVWKNYLVLYPVVKHQRQTMHFQVEIRHKYKDVYELKLYKRFIRDYSYWHLVKVEDFSIQSDL